MVKPMKEWKWGSERQAFVETYGGLRTSRGMRLEETQGLFGHDH